MHNKGKHVAVYHSGLYFTSISNLIHYYLSTNALGDMKDGYFNEKIFEKTVGEMVVEKYQVESTHLRRRHKIKTQ